MSKATRPQEDLDIFEIDYTAPAPLSNRSTNALLLEKLERTVPHWQEGGAIVFDRVKRNAIITYLRDKHPENIWAASKILGNDKQVRIYLMKKNAVEQIKRPYKKAAASKGEDYTHKEDKIK
jgi:hypothetical protein